MLKNRYQEILVGMGPMSLIRGIISLRRGRSTLLIDDSRFNLESYPGHFLSELEILSLIRLGKKFEIPELIDLRQFLVNSQIELITKERRLKLGQSPLANLKELLRKFPELLDRADLDQVYQEDEESFNKQFLSELSRYEFLGFEASVRPKFFVFDLAGPKWLKTVYQRFSAFVNQSYSESNDLKFKSLLHLLGLSHEEKLKTSLALSEIPFYFFRTISPIYRLQDFFLTIQLKRRLTLLGGDYKQSNVQYWQFFDNKFENLLLESFEGVISGERVLFFSHLPTEVPFELTSPFNVFRKTQVVHGKRVTTPFPPTSLTLIADSELLGSERPYRALSSGSEFASYQWPYPDLPGSKPQFYERDLKEAFNEDLKFVPVEKSPVEVAFSSSVTMDLRSLVNHNKNEALILKKLPLEISAHARAIKGFEYWGPFRYQSLGLLALSYGIEGS